MVGGKVKLVSREFLERKPRNGIREGILSNARKEEHGLIHVSEYSLASLDMTFLSVRKLLNNSRRGQPLPSSASHHLFLLPTPTPISAAKLPVYSGSASKQQNCYCKFMLPPRLRHVFLWMWFINVKQLCTKKKVRKRQMMKLQCRMWTNHEKRKQH